MKKTFTFLAVAFLMTSAAFAQYNNNQPGNNNYGNNNYGNNSYGNNQVVVAADHRGNWDNGHHFFGEREKNMQIDRINYVYDKKIEHVENAFFMGRHKKDCKIAELQSQRDYEIGCVVAKFNERKVHFDQDDNHYDHDRRNW